VLADVKYGEAVELRRRLGLQLRERSLEAGYVELAFPAPFIDLVARAAKLATDLGSQGIHARHILAAAATDDESLTSGLLTVLGSTAPDLRQTLRDVVDATTPEDDSALWDAFLASTVAPLDLEGGATADLCPLWLGVSHQINHAARRVSAIDFNGHQRSRVC
jgi:hypothetical protein